MQAVSPGYLLASTISFISPVIKQKQSYFIPQFSEIMHQFPCSNVDFEMKYEAKENGLKCVMEEKGWFAGREGSGRWDESRVLRSLLTPQTKWHPAQTEAVEPPARYRSSQSAAGTWGPPLVCVYCRPCGKNNTRMAARWPPNRCGAHICARPAVRVGKAAAWILFLHINTRARPAVVYSDAHACLSVFGESIQ